MDESTSAAYVERGIARDARAVELQHEGRRFHRLLDDHRLRLRERRRIRDRRGEGILAPRPVAEDLRRQAEAVGRRDVSREDQRRVVRHVVPVLDLAHLLGRRGQDDLAVPDGVLVRVVRRRPQQRVHRAVELEVRVRLVAIELARDDRPLAHQLLLEEQRIAHRVLHELHAGAHAVHAEGDEVVDALVGCGAVPLRAELARALQILLLRRDRLVGLEEHVLVQMREPLELRGLRVRAVLHVQLDRHERDGVVLHDDDVESVGERGVAHRQRLRARPSWTDQREQYEESCELHRCGPKDVTRETCLRAELRMRQSRRAIRCTTRRS